MARTYVFLLIFGFSQIAMAQQTTRKHNCPTEYETLAMCVGAAQKNRSLVIRVSIQVCKKANEIFVGVLDSGTHASLPVLNRATVIPNPNGTTTFD
ncbi:MAG TPA: hypothetical protein VFV50_18545, partial [Bdellovibrionales bacterium]|nr:hypothetical protein [Bdellovibrionales bacterium]